MPATGLRRAAERAQQAERERIKRVEREHLATLAAERKAAREAIERRSGQQDHWPIGPNARRG